MVAPRRRLSNDEGLEVIKDWSDSQADLTLFPSVPAEHVSFDPLRLPSCPLQYSGACSTPGKI